MAKRETPDQRAVRAIRQEAEEERAVLEAVAHPDDLPPASIVKALGEIKLTETDGSETELATLWRDRPAALVFLRHYG
jgi:hypothetical protein